MLVLKEYNYNSIFESVQPLAKPSLNSVVCFLSNGLSLNICIKEIPSGKNAAHNGQLKPFNNAETRS